MEIYVHNRVCRKAVLRFVQEIARTTALKPEVRLVHTPPDIDFGAAADRRFLIEWKEPGSDDAADDLQDEGDRECGPATGSTIGHYQKTIVALAANAEAARAFLDLAQGRQRRTGQAANGNAG
jgi:hypothetical protein